MKTVSLAAPHFMILIGLGVALFTPATAVALPACTDSDGDGYFVEAGCGSALDCNDASTAIHPGAVETCDGYDTNCDGSLDNGTGCARACPAFARGGFRILTEPATKSWLPELAWTGSQYGLAWDDGRNGNREIYFARLDAEGRKIGGDVRVTNDPAASAEPEIVWNGSEFGIVWSDTRDGARGIYFARIDETGAKIGGDVRVTTAGANAAEPSLVWAGWRWGLAWSDTRTGRSEIWFTTLSRAGGRLVAEVQVSDWTGILPKVVWTGNEFGVASQTLQQFWGEPQIVYARLSGTGSVLQVTLVSDSINSYAQNPTIAWTGTEYGVAWNDEPIGGPQGIYFRRLTAAGTVMGSYQFVGFAGLARPLIRWTGLEYGVAWTAYPGIGFVRLSPAGAPIGSAVQISNDGGQLTGLQWTGAAYGAASWQWFSASLWDIAFTRIGCNCTDADLDGVTNCEDCDDASASAWRPPNEVTGVRFAANKQQISWDPPDDPGSAAGTIRYDTLRSPSAADFQNPGVCLEPNGSDTSSVDPAIPLAGSVWFYLVRAEGGCTAGGLLGLTSAGTERTAGSCP